ncbi:YraN family protein [bacterium]|nr:YraN family protein [bacterium]
MWSPPLFKNMINLFSTQKPEQGLKKRPHRSVRAWLTPHLRLGFLAERQACAYLQKRGVTIIERNYWTPEGEIDLIARDRQKTIFIEVKFRSSSRFAPPEASVDRKKRQTIKHVACEYIRKKNLDSNACRYDIITLVRSSLWEKTNIRWLKDAF